MRIRLIIGALVSGETTRAFFMDKMVIGLDSSIAFQIVSSLRQFILILNGTALISLLQPVPETCNPFNDIILLSDGKIMYEGPCENAYAFFEFMGSKCPKRKGVVEFLQEVMLRNSLKCLNHFILARN